MAYMYDMLKNAIGGFNLSSNNSTIKNWSPNSIKALVISRNCIVVVYHLKPVKLISLDLNEVSADIANSRGAMHNLLAQRQLSCLEEILVDSLFKNYRNLMDLNGYVSKLLSDKSRLRYYGYIGKVDTTEIVQKYTEAQRAEDVSYSFCCDTSRVTDVWYTAVGNVNWYKNYNLRPQFYALDSDNGLLHRWFARCEAKLEGLEEQEKELTTLQQRYNVINLLFNQDMANVKELSYISKLLRKLNGSEDEVHKLVHHHLAKAIRDIAVCKISVEELRKSIRASNNPNAKHILGVYKTFGVVVSNIDDDSYVDLQVLSERADNKMGLLDVVNMLDNVCCEVYQDFKGRGGAYIFLLAIAFSKVSGRLPAGKFRSLFKLPSGTVGDTMAYVEYLSLIAGVDLNLSDKKGGSNK